MDDLVDVLHNTGRLVPRDQHVSIQRQVLIEAACEIERLRALVAEWEQVWAMVTPGDSDDDYHAWQRANEAPTVYSEPIVTTKEA